MDVKKLMAEGSLDNLSEDLFKSVSSYSEEVKAFQRQKAAEYADQVVAALKKIEQDIKDRYDRVGLNLEKRVLNIKDGKDGINGRDGRDGKDGKAGAVGLPGRDGKDGKNGRDGVDGKDGVSVVNAFLDFDNSLVIELSNGKQVNAGAILGADFAEKVKIIANGGGTSQGVIDTLASLQAQISAISSLGAVSYQGTWNASTNTPTITASVGTKGYYYVVSVAGTTSINGESKWGVGDWIVFNGSTWQKVDGGSTGNLTTLDVSGAATIGTDLTLSGGTANGVAYLNSSKVLTTGSALTFDGSKLTVSATSGELGLLAATGTSNYLSIKGDTGGTTIWNGIGTDTGVAWLGSVSNHPVSFRQNNVEQMRLTSTGLGIGTSSPSRKLSIGGTTNAYMDFNATSYRRFTLGSDSSGFVLYDDTAGAYRAIIDSSGNLGIGTSSITNKLTVNGSIGASGTGGAYSLYRRDTNAYAGGFYSPAGGILVDLAGVGTALTLDSSGNLGLGVTPSTWYSTYKALQISSNGSFSTNTDFFATGNNYYTDATATEKFLGSGYALKHRTVSSSGKYEWYVSTASGTAGAAVTFTQAMTLDSSGDWFLGTTTIPSATQKGIRLCSDITARTPKFSVGNVTTNQYMIEWVNGNGIVGSISTSGTATAYNTSSDYRLKENVQPMTGALAKVVALKPVTYKWKADGSDGEGFIAHELAEVVPQCVTGEKDAVDAEGNPKYQGIDTSFLVATLTAAIQELKAEVDSLKAQLNK